MSGLREWLAERSASLASVARGLVAAWERLVSEVSGRELAEIAARQELAEMLLGGFEPDAEEPYARGSLARLYMALYGVQVSTPRRLALRLRDGLPLSIAGRGVVVEASKTRFVRLVESVAAEAERLSSELGAEAKQVVFDTADPLWGLEAARRLVEEGLRVLPPYSSEALALFSASAPAPLGAAVAVAGGSGYADELRSLAEGVFEVFGAEQPGERGLLRVLVRPGKLLKGYRCLAHRLLRLLQLGELREFIEAPDPLEEMIGEAFSELDEGLASKLREASEAAPSPRLPAPGGNSCEPGPEEEPALPAGAAAYTGTLTIVDVEVKAKDGRSLGTYSELVTGLLPLLYRGLAGIEPLEEEDGRLTARWWAVLPRSP